MRNLFAFLGLSCLAAACTGEPAPPADPPVLKVTSPARSFVQAQAGQVQVTGTVASNPEGDPIKTVLVNDVPAIVGSDGAFSATITVNAGASLIHTVATDTKGGNASDTRSVQAGTLTSNGSTIPSALTAAISTPAFAKISAAASTLIAQTDLGAMLAPLQPMQHSGDENGPDCLYEQVYIDGVAMTNTKFSLVPTDGGINFTAEIDGLDVPAHANYALACVSDSTSLDVRADKVVVSGTLIVTPDGKGGFTTTLDSPNVVIAGLDVSASGLPGDILDMIDFNGVLTYVVEKGAEMFMGPMMNDALGALGGPKTVMLMGQTITMQVTPSDVELTPAGGVVSLDTAVAIAGSEKDRGFVAMNAGHPTMNAGTGFEMAVAQDLANEMMAEFTGIGMLNLTMPSTGGSFDSVQIGMTVPPMISANGNDGKLHVVAGDMTMTFMLLGKPVGTAALNATMDVTIAPATTGSAVGIQLTNPVINIDVNDDATNKTHFEGDDLSALVTACIGDQIQTMSALLSNIPIPSIAGLQMQNVSVGANSGYVMLSGSFE